MKERQATIVSDIIIRLIGGRLGYLIGGKAMPPLRWKLLVFSSTALICLSSERKLFLIDFILKKTIIKP